MSIDYYFKPDDPNKKFTPLDLQNLLGANYQLTDINQGDDGFVTSFKVNPKVTANTENLIFEFHQQDDGRWWHPLPARSDEGFEVDELVASDICIELGLEPDF